MLISKVKKQEFIDRHNEKHKESIKSICKLPDLPDSFSYNYFLTSLGEAMLTKTIDYADLGVELHKLRGVIGDYQIMSYWVPYDGCCVCAEYAFGSTIVWYTINDQNCDYIIDKLSGGKCAVVETTKKEVMCNC